MAFMNRRGFLLGLGAALAAPAIVRAGSLMPVRALSPKFEAYTSWFEWRPDEEREWSIIQRLSDISTGIGDDPDFIRVLHRMSLRATAFTSGNPDDRLFVD